MSSRSSLSPDHANSNDGKGKSIKMVELESSQVHRRESVSEEQVLPKIVEPDHAPKSIMKPSRSLRSTMDKKPSSTVLNIHEDSEEEKSTTINPERMLEKEREKEQQEQREREMQKAKDAESSDWFSKCCTTIFCWKMSHLSIPIGPLIFGLIFFSAMGLLFYLYFEKINSSGIPLYSWFIWTVFLIFTYVLLEFTLKMLFVLVKKLLFFSRFYYYINGLAGTMSLFFWSLIHTITWESILNYDSGGRVSFLINNIFLCVVWISVLRCFKLVGEKALLAYMQRNVLWKSLSDFLFREKVLEILIKPPRGKGINTIKISERRIKLAVNTSQGDRKDDSLKPNPVDFRKAWKSVLKFTGQRGVKVKDYTFSDVIDVAKSLMENVDVDDKSFIVLDDFFPFFKSNSAAEQAFAIFDKNKDGRINMEEVIMVIREIYKDRKALYNTLHDREDIALIFTKTLGGIFWFLMFMLGLYIFGVDMGQLLLPLTTTMVTFAFIFGESIKNFWENFLFIFLERPYDVGDRITFEGMPTLIVSRIRLYTTEAFATDGRHFILPNATIRSCVITQYKRSKDYAVYVQVAFGMGTSKEQINKLQKRIRKWLSEDTTAPWKADDAMFWISELTNTNKVVMDTWVELRGVNWQVPRLFLIPKTNLLLTIQRICKELNITYKLPPQPVEFKDASSNKELIFSKKDK